MRRLQVDDYLIHPTLVHPGDAAAATEDSEVVSTRAGVLRRDQPVPALPSESGQQLRQLVRFGVHAQ